MAWSDGHNDLGRREDTRHGMPDDWWGGWWGEREDPVWWGGSWHCPSHGKGKGNGKGKGSGKGKGEGTGYEKLLFGNLLPPVNSSLIFSSYEHRFYDDFPAGKQIRARDAGVDFYRPIEVLDAKAVTCKRIDRWGVTSDSLYVAVKFQSVSGAFIWTNFSRGGIAMLNFLVK